MFPCWDGRVPRRCVMADVWYLGLTVGFFALTWAFLKLCERV
jgi:hypothetical protein